MVCPCKDCTERFPACHSQCPSYKAWSAEHTEKREQAHKKKLEYDAFYNYMQQAVANMQNREQRRIAKQKYKKN